MQKHKSATKSIPSFSINGGFTFKFLILKIRGKTFKSTFLFLYQFIALHNVVGVGILSKNF